MKWTLTRLSGVSWVTSEGQPLPKLPESKHQKRGCRASFDGVNLNLSRTSQISIAMNYLEIERGIKHAESSVADRTSSDPHHKTSASKACDEHAQVHTQVENVGELSQNVCNHINIANTNTIYQSPNIYHSIHNIYLSIHYQ